MGLKLLYLYRNLTRNPLRTVLTSSAVALPITIYILSMAVVDGVQRFLDNSARQLRLAVTQKASIINPLPEGYRAKMESLDPSRTRLLSVCGLRWIGGKVQDDPRPLSTLAADSDTFVATFPEYQLTEEEVAAWQRDRQAIIVGAATARQFGWKVGDRITIAPLIPPYTPLEFHVISTAPKAKDPVTNWFHRAYWEQGLEKTPVDTGQISFFFVKCAAKADVDYFRQAIDELFKGHLDETKTQDEKAFMTEYITQQFNLPRNLTILAYLTVIVAAMAAANTMSINLRDRLNEVAVLKSLGFRMTLIFTQIQAESLLVCGLGGAVGALIPYVAFTHTPLKNFTVPLIQYLEIHPVVCAQAVLVSLLVGVAAAIWPCYMTWRTSTIAALRNLE